MLSTRSEGAPRLESGYVHLLRVTIASLLDFWEGARIPESEVLLQTDVVVEIVYAYLSNVTVKQSRQTRHLHNFLGVGHVICAWLDLVIRYRTTA